MEKFSLSERLYLKRLYYWNRVRFARLKWHLKGRVEFADGCEISVKDFRYRGFGKVYFKKGAMVLREEFPTIFDTEKGSEIIVGERVFLRGKYGPNVLTAFENARIEIGDDGALNHVTISAKRLVKAGKKALLSWGVNIMDSDLHDLSNTRKESIASVEIGDYVLVGSYATILPGVKIGSHCVIGANSVVTRDIPDHSIAAGNPARVLGQIDDRNLAI